MPRLTEKLREEDSGEIMLESTIVILITLFMLIAILSLGFAYYQQSMLITVANETAEMMGSSYKYAGQSDLDRIEVNSSTVQDIKMYRSSFQLATVRAQNKTRADAYVPVRIGYTNLGINEYDPYISSLDTEVDNIGRMHVNVTVEMKTQILFQGALLYFGIFDETPTFSASARAECLDITAYAGHVQYVEYIDNKVSDLAVSGIIDNIVETVKNIAGIVQMF